jgi:hypothetical protein
VSKQNLSGGFVVLELESKQKSVRDRSTHVIAIEKMTRWNNKKNKNEKIMKFR